jgi:3-dehydrosphinganine reductase
MICGGSSGLGAATAKHLAARGADITILARSQNNLDLAKAEIEAVRTSQNQKITSVSVDLSNAEEVSIFTILQSRTDQAPRGAGQRSVFRTT